MRRLYFILLFTLAYSTVTDIDGGYVITGEKWYNSGPQDLYLIKTDINGYIEWDRIYGDIDYDDVGKSVKQTIDGGYIVSGGTRSYGDGTWGSWKAWLIKTDSEGNVEE